MKKIVALSALIFFSLHLFALNPSRTYAALPSDYGMEYKEIRIPTTDNLNLTAWVFKPSGPTNKKYIIISASGNGNMGDNLDIAGQFLSIGYNVVMYDYRGYGKSDSFHINKNFFIYSQFSKDLISVIEYVRANYNPTFDLYGIGMGAGLSLAVGANRQEIKRIIADGPYSTLDDMKAKAKAKKGVDYLMPIGYDKNYLEPQYALADKGNQLAGIFYIVGEKDELMNAVDIKNLIKVHPKQAEMYVVPGVSSDADFSTNKNEYFAQIKKFLLSHPS